MVRRLILMRHAKSDWADHSLSDHDRPLNARGRLAAPKMARHLSENHLAPKVVLASTAVRVRETLGLMLAEWGYEPVVFYEQALYLASVDTLKSQVRGLDDSWSDAMLIGHNPGLADYASRLASQPLEMPTAAVAVFESTAESWHAVTARNIRLTAHWRPRDLFD
jgi:phosphohistidine phosphatase